MRQPAGHLEGALEYARGGGGLPPPSTFAGARPYPRAVVGRSDAPSFNLEALNEQLGGATAQEIIAWAAQTHGNGLVMTTSFGIQSAVMLHLATSVVPRIPVIWLDTGYLPPETYRFAAELSERLDLNLQVYQSPISPARMEALYGRLWQSGGIEDLDRYNRIRKVEPLRRALDELGARAWLAGLRASQTDHRGTLPRIGEQDGRSKILPILDWTGRDVHFYLHEHDLPYHPLWHQDYVTVGDWHSSRPITAEDTHQRDSRFGGAKQECGIHLPGTAGEEKSLQSSEL